LLFWSARWWRASRKVRLNFVQNRYSQPVNIIILSGERLTDDINITQIMLFNSIHNITVY
jgi:hypothetical protein